MKKKLIEVALPLDDINKASAREKSILFEAGAMLEWCQAGKLYEPEVRDGCR